MKFVLIFGPGASGKMTVGQELEKITGLKLLHNHMTIELVRPFFRMNTPEGNRLTKLFRNELLEAFAQSDQYGLIYTKIWDFDSTSSWESVNEICAIFESRGADVCFVELEADFDERKHRNSTPNRLLHKPSKRDLGLALKFLQREEDSYRMNSLPGEITREKCIRINTTALLPEDAAKMIKERFSL